MAFGFEPYLLAPRVQAKALGRCSFEKEPQLARIKQTQKNDGRRERSIEGFDSRVPKAAACESIRGELLSALPPITTRVVTLDIREISKVDVKRKRHL